MIIRWGWPTPWGWHDWWNGFATGVARTCNCSPNLQEITISYKTFRGCINIVKVVIFMRVIGHTLQFLILYVYLWIYKILASLHRPKQRKGIPVCLTPPGALSSIPTRIYWHILFLCLFWGAIKVNIVWNFTVVRRWLCNKGWCSIMSFLFC